jgi:hypothetical protein
MNPVPSVTVAIWASFRNLEHGGVRFHLHGIALALLVRLAARSEAHGALHARRRTTVRGVVEEVENLRVGRSLLFSVGRVRTGADHP